MKLPLASPGISFSAARTIVIDDKGDEIRWLPSGIFRIVRSRLRADSKTENSHSTYLRITRIGATVETDILPARKDELTILALTEKQGITVRDEPEGIRDFDRRFQHSFHKK